jgi:hypothetical protein
MIDFIYGEDNDDDYTEEELLEKLRSLSDEDLVFCTELGLDLESDMTNIWYDLGNVLISVLGERLNEKIKKKVKQ